ncbi:MAG: hypothetical protein HQM03_17075 [Magnetococcales bacterium]|nr:hypothetical protein [Magnetococcales bacterium]
MGGKDWTDQQRTQTQNALCARIAAGETLVQALCPSEGENIRMPHRSQVYQWLDSDPEFERRYALARAFQADQLVDSILSISNEMQYATTRAEIKSAEWKIRSIMWLAERLNPTMWGGTTRTSNNTNTAQALCANDKRDTDPLRACRRMA